MDERVKEFLKENHFDEVNCYSCHNMTPLHWAVKEKNEDMCKLLIPLTEPDIFNILTSWSRVTVLHTAAFKGMSDICKLLIPLMSDRGINTADSTNSTALSYAIRYCESKELYEMLIPRMNYKSLTAINVFSKYSALDYAREVGETEIAEMIENAISKCKIKDTLDSMGYTGIDVEIT